MSKNAEKIGLSSRGDVFDLCQNLQVYTPHCQLGARNELIHSKGSEN